MTAEDLILELRNRDGRVYRFVEVAVICLTKNPKTAAWLHKLGGRPFVPKYAERSLEGMPLGAYRRAKGGVIEWDFYIHLIPVVGDETIWEAAGRLAPTVVPEDFA